MIFSFIPFLYHNAFISIITFDRTFIGWFSHYIDSFHCCFHNDSHHCILCGLTVISFVTSVLISQLLVRAGLTASKFYKIFSHWYFLVYAMLQPLSIVFSCIKPFLKICVPQKFSLWKCQYPSKQNEGSLDTNMNIHSHCNERSLKIASVNGKWMKRLIKVRTHSVGWHVCLLPKESFFSEPCRRTETFVSLDCYKLLVACSGCAKGSVRGG